MHHAKFPCILITVDCLRVDHVGCLGYSRPTTPNIDNVAKDSVVFTNAFSNGPYTTSSFASIFTSAIMLRYCGEDIPLPSERPTIAEILQKNGVSAAAFHSNPYLSSEFSYDRGFSYFEDFGAEYVGKEEKVRGLRGQIHGLLANLNNKVLTNLARQGTRRSMLSRVLSLLSFYYVCLIGYSGARADGAMITDKAISWLKRNQTDFVWLHYMDVHEPYVPPKKCRNRFCSERLSNYRQANILRKRETPELASEEEVATLVDLYDAAISYVDERIGVLISELKAMGIYDDCLIIITADHGEEFKEHGGFSHSCKLYDELLHIPLIVKVPGDIYRKKTDGLCSLIDLGPTILEVLKIPACPSFDGASLLSMMQGRESGRPWVISACGSFDKEREKKEKLVSLRMKEWKYILKEDGQDELYNLSTDPGEKDNLAMTNPEKAEELKSKVLELSSKIHYELPATPSISRDEKMKMRLKALGYS